MNLEQILIRRLEGLGPFKWKRMFGLQALLIDGKLMGGYKKIDESVIYLMLILSPGGFKKASKSGYFSKFDFGKTWVEGEVTGEEDIDLIWQTVEDSYNFTKSKPAKNGKKN